MSVTSFIKTAAQKLAIKLFNTRGVKEFLLLGGSRSGKSFIIVYAIIVIASMFPNSRHLIARFRFNHVKSSIWKDTLPKVLKICFPNLVVKWNNTDYYITLPNGSEIWIAGIDDAERSEKILGMEFLTIFLNECSQISYDAYTTIKTRLAQKIAGARTMLFLDENPPSKKHWTYKVFIEGLNPQDKTAIDKTKYAWLRMNPKDNLDNISGDYLEFLASLPKKKRDRFLDGLFTDDSEFALWTEKIISDNRVLRAPAMKRIVVALDPSVTSKKKSEGDKTDSDEFGIIVAGVDFMDEVYIFEDATDIYTPSQWAKEAVHQYRKHQADRCIGEVNNGGDMIEYILRNEDESISYSSVRATRDKTTRAEPVVALYEKGRVHHVGELPELELEQTSWEAKKGDHSPNRIDALVWAVTELVLNDSFEIW